MSISNFPVALRAAIQQNFLEREFREGLESQLTYRSIADLEIFPANVGETVTKTRKGLKAPVTTPLDPTTNTNLDNGLTPSTWTIEQYTLAVNMYGDSIDLNMVTQGVGIADQFLHNARTNGIQAMQSVDRVARKALYDAYMSGNTKVRTTLGSAGPTIAVDDVRGFQNILVNGALQPVSTSNKMVVTVNGTSYNLQAVAVDGSNVSITPGGISGTLTMDANVTTGDGTAGNAVVGFFAPAILRAGARSTSSGLLSTDLLTMGQVMDGVTILRNNAVPTVDGLYEVYLDPTSARQIFADDDFKLLYRGTGSATEEWRKFGLIELLDVRFKRTTEAIQQKIGNVNVHRPIICGEGTMVEGVYADTAYNNLPELATQLVEIFEGIAMVTRAPLDRLAQIIAQSWYYIGGFVCPTDITATQSIIPTANNALYKRACILEHGG